MFIRWSKRILGLLLLILIIGFIVPEGPVNPVKGATKADWNPTSFWHYPWGKSVVHKGIDIFAKKGTPVQAPTWGRVIYTGEGGRGGKAVLLLGPKWRIHYFAHLNEITAKKGEWVGQKDLIGTVGTSGNASGKPPHLHYALITLVPYPWRIDNSPHGTKKMFFLNPEDWMETDGS